MNDIEYLENEIDMIAIKLMAYEHNIQDALEISEHPDTTEAGALSAQLRYEFYVNRYHNLQGEMECLMMQLEDLTNEFS